MAPYSVERHIAYINEVRTVANGRDQTRTVANVRPLQDNDKPGSEQARTDATVRSSDERYIKRLESDNEFLRGQLTVKDKTIDALLERDRETNILIAGLQKLLRLPSGPEPDRQP